jgi:hypothetical protein
VLRDPPDAAAALWQVLGGSVDIAPRARPIPMPMLLPRDAEALPAAVAEEERHRSAEMRPRTAVRRIITALPGAPRCAKAKGWPPHGPRAKAEVLRLACERWRGSDRRATVDDGASARARSTITSTAKARLNMGPGACHRAWAL